MPEILTESFCERCGTRYTFQAAAAARSPLTRVKTLSKGFRNYVLSDETSLSEAMASARSDDLRRTSGEQLDAFHKAFNFCMSCRQYTCANCWNDIDGRCLSCSPTFDPNALATPYPMLDHVIGLPALDAANGNGHANGATNGTNGHVEAPLDGADISAWPSIDLEPEAAPDVVSSTAEPAIEAVAAEAIVAEPLTDQAIEVAPEMAAAATPAETDREHVAAYSPETTEDEEPISPERLAAMFGSPGEPEAEPVARTVDRPFEAAAEAPAAEAVTEPVDESVDEPVASSAVLDTAAVPDAIVAADASVDAPTAPVAAETAAEPSVEDDPEPIADLEGWAANAAAQTSTLLNRFRAFPGKLAADRPKNAERDAIAATHVSMDDQPLSIPLPTVNVDVAPVIDLFMDAPTPGSVAAPTAPVVEAVEPEREMAAEPEPVEATAPGVETMAPEPEAAPFAEPEPAVSAAEPEPVAAAEPEAIVAAEPETIPELVAAVVEPAAVVAEPEPVAAEPEPVVEPEPVAAAPVAPTPEPAVAAAPEPVAPASEPFIPPPAPVAPTVPVWQIVAPDLMPPSAIPSNGPAPSATPVWPPLAKSVAGEPQWPAVPTWPTRQPTPTVSGADAVWAQSSRDLLNRPETGVQACVNCGLALSARARFCRRCGTNQVSA